MKPSTIQPITQTDASKLMSQYPQGNAIINSNGPYGVQANQNDNPIPQVTNQIPPQNIMSQFKFVQNGPNPVTTQPIPQQVLSNGQSNLRKPPTATNDLSLNTLEQKVESMSEKLSKLENRVESEEKMTLSTRAEVTDIKTSLDRNFNKLDIILEKLANKLA
jgi:hypothetical protein